MGKISLPQSIAKELRVGESIYHSSAKNHVSTKYFAGKWIAEVRRVENNRQAMSGTATIGTYSGTIVGSTGTSSGTLTLPAAPAGTGLR